MVLLTMLVTGDGMIVVEGTIVLFVVSRVVRRLVRVTVGMEERETRPEFVTHLKRRVEVSVSLRAADEEIESDIEVEVLADKELESDVEVEVVVDEELESDVDVEVVVVGEASNVASTAVSTISVT